MIASETPNPSKCPNCGKPVLGEPSEAMPFCSTRCQQIDLSRWLGEEYSVPLNGNEDEADIEHEDDLDASHGAY